MFTTIRDLFRFSPSFRFGSLILLLVAVMIALSFFSPYEGGKLRRKVKRNQPPSATFVFGTTSQGEDVFWSTTFAIRNTLMISIIAVTIGRGIGVILGMLSGYLGGIFDRVAQSHR